MGRFASGQEGHEELIEVTKKAQPEALISQQSEETVFTWPRTQEEMDRMYPDKETLVVDGEEAVMRVMGLLKEGTCLKEEVEEGDEGEVDERPDTSTPLERVLVKPGVETIESLSQSLGIRGEATIDEDINMTDICNNPVGLRSMSLSGPRRYKRVCICNGILNEAGNKVQVSRSRVIQVLQSNLYISILYNSITSLLA